MRRIGTVVNYRRSGYGWLDWDGQSVWLHIQDVRDKGHMLPELRVGQRIEFDLKVTPKGLRAINARVVETINAEGTHAQKIAAQS